MRKDLGKPTRELFFALLDEAAPDFRRCSTHDIKGFTWSFLRQQQKLHQWLRFQRHKYDDSFTVELSWSCVREDPSSPPHGNPEDVFTLNGCRFRLGAFWDRNGDYWWHIVDPPVWNPNGSFEDRIKSLLNAPEIDMEKALPRVRIQVEDALNRIRVHALPYFDKVSKWALSNE